MARADSKSRCAVTCCHVASLSNRGGTDHAAAYSRTGRTRDCGDGPAHLGRAKSRRRRRRPLSDVGWANLSAPTRLRSLRELRVRGPPEGRRWMARVPTMCEINKQSSSVGTRSSLCSARLAHPTGAQNHPGRFPSVSGRPRRNVRSSERMKRPSSAKRKVAEPSGSARSRARYAS